MAYETVVDPIHKIVECVYHGDVDLNESIRARADTVRMSKEHHSAYILFDMSDCRMSISTSDLYQFGNSFDKSGIPEHVVSCVVKADDQKSQFLENVVRNRLSKIRFFSCRDEAAEWLGIDA